MSHIRFGIFLLSSFLLGIIGSLRVFASFSPPSSISLRTYRLESSGALWVDPATGDYHLCSTDDTYYGCTAFVGNPSYSYPYGADNPVTIPIESDYLLDVVPQELPSYYHPTAVQAQAIAARSYAYWHINQGSTINNSTQFQAFIPYKFESLQPDVSPDNSSNPCASSNLNSDQQIICQAVAPRYYISYGTPPNDDLPAFTEFSADAWGQTTSGSLPYLLGVEDSISTACDANNDGHGHGMSQEGASRWAWGNQCSHASAGDIPWSIHWEHAEQILTHYYTGIHIRDADGIRLTPKWRWVPLEVDWHTSDNRAPIMYHDQRYTVTFRVQNSGTTTWPGTGQVYLGYYHNWGKIKHGEGAGALSALAPGGVREETVTLYPPSAPYPGTPCRFWFDMFLEGEQDDVGFSMNEPGRPWYTYDVVVCVDGPCRVFVPLVLRNCGQ